MAPITDSHRGRGALLKEDDGSAWFEGRMLLVQKLHNHPVLTLPAWQLDGCQTLRRLFICTQFRWCGARLRVCVCVLCLQPLLSPLSLTCLLLFCFTLPISFCSSSIRLSSAFNFPIFINWWFCSCFPLLSSKTLFVPHVISFFCLLTHGFTVSLENLPLSLFFLGWRVMDFNVL